MAMKLAETAVFINGDNAHFLGSLKKSRGSLMNFTSAVPGLLKGVAKAFLGLTAVVAATSAAITAFVVKGIKDMGRFQHNMAKVSTMIKVNTDKLTDALSKNVRKLSLEIPHATASLTNALYEILSASVPVSQSMEVLARSGKAATAGITDVTTAADLATGTANALGIAFSDMDKIFDTAFATIREGKITFGILADNLGQVLAPAKKMNASIEEVYGSIAFLTKNAMPAAIAATSLASAFDELGTKADKLEGIGVKVFGTEGQFVGLVNVIEQIGTQIGDLTDKAKVNLFKEMGFERRSARAIIAMSENVEGFRQTLEAVGDSAGATNIAFERMANTLVNKWQGVKNSFAELSRTIGDEFGEATGKILDYVKQLVDNISRAITAEGGLISFWRKHSTIALETFRKLTTLGLKMVGALMRSMGSLVIESASLIWTPLIYSFGRIMLGVNTRFKKAIAMMGDAMAVASGRTPTTNIEERLAQIDAEAEEWKKLYTAAMNVAMDELAQKGTQILMETMSKMKKDIGPIAGDAGKALEEFFETLKIKPVKVPITPEMAGEAAAAPAVGPSNTAYSKASSKADEWWAEQRHTWKKAYFDMVREWEKMQAEQTAISEQEMLERTVRINELSEKDHQNAIDSKQKTEDEETAIKLQGIQDRAMLEAQAIENVAALTKKIEESWQSIKGEDIDPLESMRESAAEIEFAMQDIFSALTDGEDIWMTVWKRLADFAIKEISKIAAAKMAADVAGGGAGGIGSLLGGAGGLGALGGAGILGPLGLALGGGLLLHKMGAFAEGGVVRQPTLALVGEKGPEAIVPLTAGGAPAGSVGGSIVVQSMPITFPNVNLENIDETRIEKVMTRMVPHIQRAFDEGLIRV